MIQGLKFKINISIYNCYDNFHLISFLDYLALDYYSKL